MDTGPLELAEGSLSTTCWHILPPRTWRNIKASATCSPHTERAATRLNRTYGEPSFASGVDEGVRHAGPALETILQYCSLLVGCRGRWGQFLESETSAVVGFTEGSTPHERQTEETQAKHCWFGFHLLVKNLVPLEDSNG